MEKFLQIFRILQRYKNPEEEPYMWFFAEHDVIGFNIDPEAISEKDKRNLEELDVIYNEEYDSYVIYV